jgi:lysine decarboxylase
MEGKRYNTPLLEALSRYAVKNSVRFHMPGHKGGRGPGHKFKKSFQKNLFRWDVTEIPGLDNLHDPRGVIKRSQELLARLYNADRSFFLVNGATSGVIAMMGAALGPGDKVILSRACHKSVISALVITGASPVYTMPRWDRELGVYAGIEAENLEESIKQNPGAKAVVITNPSYQGFCPDIGRISAAAVDRGLKVLVDEAHGPHFAFSPLLPPSAGNFRVDAWVQSPHKMLCSLTQSAWLHIKGKGLDAEKLKSYIKLVTSTSPSYVLMASLDYARALMERHGKYLAEKALALAERARKLINLHTPFYCVGSEVKGRSGIFDIDLSRLMVNVSCAGFTGFEVDRALREEFNIYSEYSDSCNVYFLVTFSNSRRDVIKLVKALSSFKRKKRIIEFPAMPETLPPRATEPREAFLAGGEQVPLEYSRGRVLKEALVPYPPGVPLLMPGEVMEQVHIELINNLRAGGGYVQGAGPEGVWVVKE